MGGMRGEEEFVERECLLLEAGDYPDRGVTITEDDLAEIAANTPGEVPVKIEHLRESPFDGALGVVTRVRAAGGRLWGTLRQPAEAWRLAQRAGARALSVALDTAGRRLVETSFVCRPRVPAARVFGEGPVLFHAELAGGTNKDGRPTEGMRGPSPAHGRWWGWGTGGDMSGVRQFAEGLIQHIRTALGAGDSEEARFAAGWRELEALRARQVDQEVEGLKRRGLLRATEEAQDLARALLGFGLTNVTHFGGTEVPVGALFTRFLEANGPVAPMGEAVPGDALAGAGASDRLIALARDAARREGIPYLAAFAQVSAANPGLARAAREEAVGA